MKGMHKNLLLTILFFVTRLSVVGIFIFPTNIFLNLSGGNLTLTKLARNHMTEN
jgi:hypothetical protein